MAVSGARSRGVVARLRALGRRLDFLLARRFALSTREDRTFFLLVPAVGLVAGGLGIAIHRVIDLLRVGLWYLPGGYRADLIDAAQRSPAWLVVGAPMVAGLIVAAIAFVGREPTGGGKGMSTLIEAVALHGGRTSIRSAAVSVGAAIATVAGGGALGREGPLIRLGAAASSWLGERAGLPPFRIKILLGAGAAAGFAAAYNVPIGGALFAMEVILGSFALEIFGPIVIAAVISTLLSRAAESHTPIYAAPELALASPWELAAYFGLGLVGAVAALVFTLGVRGVAKACAAVPWLPAWSRPPLGMAALGALALLVPEVLGGGVQTIDAAVAGQLPLFLLLLLPAVRLFATALTLGTGGSGGLFTPSLCFGALVGGAYGIGVHALFPALGGGYGAYAAVGMAAVAAGTSHAPLSAAIVLFELTGNYGLILPLLVAAIVSSFVARWLYPFSIYTEPLARRGVELSYRMEEAALAGLAVGDLARPDPETLSPSDPFPRIVERFLATPRHRLFVLDDDRRLVGLVSLHDFKHALVDVASLGHLVAHDLMVPVTAVLKSSDRLHRVAELFARTDFERIPVEDADGRFVGLLSKRDFLAVYAQEVLGRPAVLSTFVASDQPGHGGQAVELPPDFALRSLPLPEPLAGRTLAECDLPRRLGVRVLEIKRTTRSGAEWIVPGAATVFQPGDLLVVLGPTAAVEELRMGRLGDSGFHSKIESRT